MIIFKTLKWSNFFSYGEDNFIDFTKDPVTQLVGQNGTGKTSIPIILQEIVFSKNVKKIVKANLTNRNTSANIFAELHFEAKERVYLLTMRRTSSKLSVTLLQDGEDISSHTAPATLKTLENILGIDFETFSQLVYQSSKSSLQFLTSTDTQRKKFLISLFNLERYIEVHELFKKALSEINTRLASMQGKYSVYEEWINQHPQRQPSMTGAVVVPDAPSDLQQDLADLNSEAQRVDSTNKRINQNNAYKRQLASIDKELIHKPEESTEGISELRSKRISITTLVKEKQKFVREMAGKSDTCPTCKQKIDISKSVEMAAIYRKEIADYEKNLSDIITQIENLEVKERSNAQIAKAITQFENLTNLITEDTPDDIIDKDSLAVEIDTVAKNIANVKRIIQKTQEHNKKVVAELTLIEAEDRQREDYAKSLNAVLNELEDIHTKAGDLEILRDAFGTNGLVSYKLEYLTKDLEAVINEYLTELSRGQFHLSFQLSGDKLNIEITDDGTPITINELSEGELSKVNVSTVLAIRKLMQSLSNTKLNILFLDEIMGVLDNYGREDLINILLKEHSLNTYLVTHEYRHPLVPIINVIKENKISRLEYEG